MTEKTQLTGITLAAIGALCWSTAGVIVRGLAVTDWEMVFWRSFFLTLFLLPFLLARPRQVVIEIRSSWGVMLASGLLLATSFVCFIVAIARTPVANILFMIAAAPLLTALIGHLFFGESVPPRTILAILAAATGVLIMVADSLRMDGLFGVVMAFAVALSVSINTNVIRRYRNVRLWPAVFLAGLFSMAVAAPFAMPSHPQPWDWAGLAFLGIVQIGLGMVFFIRGAQQIPAARAMIVGLLEVVLGPIWVWLFYQEQPTPLALTGGAVVVAAVVCDALFGGRAARKAVNS
ncbi:MAG: DMT family transporter [Verrucomicrobiota bacterium]